MTDQNPRAKELFFRADQIEERQARQAFLDAECGVDTPLRREAEALLRDRRQKQE